MTTTEIEAFARLANMSCEMAGKRVLVKREDGMFLALYGWTALRGEARVYDFNADGVANQLAEVERRYGAKWTAEALTEADLDTMWRGR